ncbi:MAG: hypothetical protein ACRBB2_07480 [Nitrosopumilus sp.]
MVRRILSLVVFTLVLSVLVSLVSSEISFAERMDSPRKQLQMGVNIEDVLCKSGYTLTLLQSDKIACLSSSTLTKLDERGYVKSILHEFQSVPLVVKPKTTDIGIRNDPSVQGNPGTSVAPEITNIPASSGSVVNFYISDDDLNTNRNGVDIIETDGLVEFFINDIMIDGPKTMIETGNNTGKFFLKLQLPNSVNGVPVTQDDVVEIRYLDQSDASGNTNTSAKSLPLSQTYAQLQKSGNDRVRIGHDFVVRIYEPDANLDSRDVDRIPLSRLEYRGEGGIRTTLNNSIFDANASSLKETGENTGLFEVIIEIPRTIDGKTVHIGDWFEIRYVDTSTPSGTSEDIKLRGKIG